MSGGIGLFTYAFYSENGLQSASYNSITNNLVWGTAGTPKYYYGDSFYRSIVGKEVDVRYYPRGLGLAELTQIFTQRKVVCIRGCQVCIDLVTCSQCISEYYLSGGKCLRCSLGCATCSGANNNQCLSCSKDYTLSATSCLSKG